MNLQPTTRCGRATLLLLAAVAVVVGSIRPTFGDEAGGASLTPSKVNQAAEELADFDVVIAGGSTSAFAAAIASAESGARTALIEPTDWVGGQLTASGVPAIDEAWHSIREPGSKRELLNVAQVARDPANMTPNFLTALQSIEHPGDCWVSRFCFCPDSFRERQLLPLEQKAGDRLVVFLDAVVKQVELDSTGKRIQSLTAIARTPRAGVRHNGYDVLPSVDLPDWYSPEPSDRFDKRTLRFIATNDRGRSTVFIDATEWGEVLALADVPFLQGIEDADGGTSGDDRCGQAIVYCFTQEIHDQQQSEATRDVQATGLGYGPYRDRADAWEQIWTYRRIRGAGKSGPGDLCLQNWGYSAKLGEGGNDYPFGYLFKSRAETAAERDDWQGGIDLDVLAAAEDRAFGWHQWIKEHAPKHLDPRQITLNSEVLGTGHGLAKLPYIRDTRRSIGLDGFILEFSDLTGPATQRTGTKFDDRVAIGAYPADVHGITTCTVPAYVNAVHDTLPFHIPFRALTNDRLENLLVAGKTLAQSFLANSATRLHPIEWSSGTAAGVAAADMALRNRTSRQAYEDISNLQKRIRKFTPIDWTMN